MVGLLFAMLEEAKPYISKYHWGKKDFKSKFPVYEGSYLNEPCFAVISGVGKANAAVATALLKDLEVDTIINIGSCGANSKNLKVGDVVIPSQLYDGDFDLSKFGKNTKNPYNLSQSQENGLKCYTFSKFVTEKIDHDDYVVDMECYAIACLCDYFKIKFIPVKIISDNANENAVNDFDGNIDTVMEDSINKVEKLIQRRLHQC
ncbi:5'-methylthioadenosine/S-adenosylhomocysteine nucleosidase [Garciella nitratireducens]|uniref:5'-methylthioadenosine/S-adenosylhomocysteine nucleosidase family protein n=1 Tax=Garciella nitratireducens TaxID=218205 RepID=UPI000DE9DAC9|nr:5'-methylthioadenosine/S-adenosylhomocysteine nucleosidase [Garciella nitratireducens]RBP46905.1 methylthioadenosine nucleosidase /adenosylhomocysteine nucleosidase [Garciella nitratireducens]